ncbi:NADH-quinone oxidoreductase subunit N [Bacteroidia bacterium]|nr:NADH-quinone oxidoreductase subunit N [Bacteroidia bacterium]GHV43733.1 NADH-quinone oxidoreductase subunit N [Bacteroidia bacterium]
MDYSNFLSMREELSLIALMLVLLVVDIVGGDKGKRWFQPLAICLMLVHTAINCVPREAFDSFGGMYLYAPMMTVVKTILNFGTLIIFLQVHRWLNHADNPIKQGEFYFLTLTTLLGMYFMISSGNFLLFFIGLETASIPMTTLIAFDKYRHKSAEAGAKYILSAIFSSAIMIFGISLIYGVSGTLYFNDAAVAFSNGWLSVMAFVFFAVGLFFKLSLVPFHLWTADVYEGAPTGVTAYLSVISKGSVAFVLFTILIKVFGNIMTEWRVVMWIVVVLTITVGNLFALRQNNIKRFLAFSSISQAGYIALTMLSASAVGMTSLVYYVLVYMLSNLAVFGVVMIIENYANKLNISDYRGLYKTNPKLSVVMMFGMFSLAGIPIWGGFFSKFFAFAAAVEQGFLVLVFIALLNTVISLFYYLKVIKAMFLEDNEMPIERIKADFPAKLALVACTVGFCIIGLISIVYDKIGAMAWGI